LPGVPTIFVLRLGITGQQIAEVEPPALVNALHVSGNDASS
jgi:hypothetical protein